MLSNINYKGKIKMKTDIPKDMRFGSRALLGVP
jgi:hypothetical protein